MSLRFSPLPDPGPSPREIAPTSSPNTEVPELFHAPAATPTARGAAVRVDPAVALTCPTVTGRCTTTLTATAQVPVTAHKGPQKNLVVARAWITTRAGATARIAFSLTSLGGPTLRKLGRPRLSVVAVRPPPTAPRRGLR